MFIKKVRFGMEKGKVVIREFGKKDKPLNIYIEEHYHYDTTGMNPREMEAKDRKIHQELMKEYNEMSKYCKDCGEKKREENQNFCESCGYEL